MSMQRARRDKQNDVSFSCVCHAIDNEFRHNFAKVAADPAIAPWTQINVMTKLDRTEA